MDNAQRILLSEIFRFVFDLQDDIDPQTIRMISQKNWDSLATVSIVAGIESEFNVTIEASEYERITSFEAVALLLDEKSK